MIENHLSRLARESIIKERHAQNTVLASSGLILSEEILPETTVSDFENTIRANVKTYAPDSIEKIPPALMITLDGITGNSGWYRSDLKVTIDAWDNESGVNRVMYSLNNEEPKVYSTSVIIQQDGVYKINAEAFDNYGNSSGLKSETISIDKTPPVITLNIVDNSEFLLKQSVNVAWSVEDNTSGIDTVVSSVQNNSNLDTDTPGLKTINITVTDKAGNQTQKTISYFVRYAYSGILQPINSDGSSVFKIGSTIPVKFQLKDANDRFVSTAIASLYLSKIDNLVTGTDIEAVSTSSATTGNLFRYDSTTDQYIFNLSTKGLSKGTWELRINLDDGKIISVPISLR